MPDGSKERWLRKLLRALWRFFFGWIFKGGRPSVSNAEASGPANFHLQPDEHWDADGKFPLDPRLRVVLAQLEFGNAAQIKERAGIDLSANLEQTRSGLRVFVELNVPLTASVQHDLRQSADLHIADAYVHDAAEDESLRVFPALVKLSVRGIVIDAEAARSSVRAIVQDKRVSRLELAPLATASLEPAKGETLADFNLPADRKITIGGQSRVVDGAGVIIGIIDDGCALAHWNFLSAKNRSRIRYIWDQTDVTPAAPWTAPPSTVNYGKGRELVNAPITGPIDVALAAHTNAAGVIDEQAVYVALDFPQQDAPSHGTHVMDIAAGNGTALFGREGVAPKAEIIFVQLPAIAVDEGGAGLFACIADGADYIFRRAKDLEAQLGHAIPAVVNVSFANHLGAHDGSSLAEIRLDDMLKFDNRAIVLAAGNGFASGCHSSGSVSRANPASLHWVISGGDESVNSMEIWYTKAPDIELYLTPPGSSTELGPVLAGDPRLGLYNAANQLIGHVDHVGSAAAANGDSQILITVNGTLAYPGSTPVAPAGTWMIRLAKPNAGAANVYHAWIEHDEARRGSLVHRRQSRFADAEVDPRYSISGSACGESTIAVGAYNAGTNQVAEYSACGPTRSSTGAPHERNKPELCAPSAADARGRGTLSAATRFALSTRLGGTSAAAPHVTGLAALAFQLHRDAYGKPMSAKKLRDRLEKGAAAGGRALKPNAHQLADPNQRRKQSEPAIWSKLVGWGRADAENTLKKL